MTVAEAVTLISAVTAAIVAILTAGIGFYTAMKASSTHTLVNGLSGSLNVANRAQGQAEGRLAEATHTDTPPTKV